MSGSSGVLLVGSVFVSELALKTLLALEEAGHAIQITGEMFMVTPKGKPFTQKQQQALQQVRPQLARLVRYVENEEYAVAARR